MSDETANAAESSAAAAAAAAADAKQLAGMRGREEEGQSDEAVAALHMAYLHCADTVALAISRARVSNGFCLTSGEVALERAFASLDDTLVAFVAKFSSTLQLSLCEASAASDPSLALAKKVSPEAAGYNQQAKPALGSLIAVLLFLTGHAEKKRGGATAQAAEEEDSNAEVVARICQRLSRASLDRFLVAAFGHVEAVGEETVAEVTVADRRPRLVGRFAYWLCNALEAGALWLTVSRKSNANKEKEKKPLGGALGAAKEAEEERIAGKADGSVANQSDDASASAIVSAFLAKTDPSSPSPFSPAPVSQTPVCVQLQRLELLSWAVAVAGGAEEQPVAVHVALLGRVASVLLGRAGAEHHAHNARRSVATWGHMARMLRRCAGACGKGGGGSAVAVEGERNAYTADSFIAYLEEKVVAAFARRDRGVAAMANLYRRRLEDSLVGYSGATMESLRAAQLQQQKEEEQQKEAAASTSLPDADGAKVSEAIGSIDESNAAGVRGSFASSSGSGSGGAHHQQGYHDCARRIATSKPSETEIAEAAVVFGEAFGLRDADGSVAVLSSATARPLLEVVAMFWLRPPCVAAA